MMRVISAVTTSVIINVTTILIATATPVGSSSSDSLIISNSPEQLQVPKYVRSYVVISNQIRNDPIDLQYIRSYNEHINYNYMYVPYVTGFAKTVLKGTFCISRNTKLKY